MADNQKSTASRTARLVAFFRAHPNEWHPGIGVISQIGGAYAWRSRISDARTQFGLRIVNRQRRVRRPDGTAYVVSEYALDTSGEAGRG